MVRDGAPMTNVTVQLSDREIEAQGAHRQAKRRGGTQAWAACANAKRSAAELRAALKDSLKEAVRKGGALTGNVRSFGGSRACHSPAPPPLRMDRGDAPPDEASAPHSCGQPAGRRETPELNRVLPALVLIPATRSRYACGLQTSVRFRGL